MWLIICDVHVSLFCCWEEVFAKNQCTWQTSISLKSAISILQGQSPSLFLVWPLDFCFCIPVLAMWNGKKFQKALVASCGICKSQLLHVSVSDRLISCWCLNACLETGPDWSLLLWWTQGRTLWLFLLIQILNPFLLKWFSASCGGTMLIWAINRPNPL